MSEAATRQADAFGLLGEASLEAMVARAERAGRLQHPTEIVGVKNHPQEVIVRNGELAFPYFEGDVKWLPGEDSGLYILLCVGDPFVFFGRAGVKDDLTGRHISLFDGHLPIVDIHWDHDGIRYEQQVFAHLIGAREVVTGEERLVARVRLSATNTSSGTRPLRLLYVFGNVTKAGPPSIYYTLSRDEPPPRYVSRLALDGDLLLNDRGQVIALITADAGMVVRFAAEATAGSWQAGTWYHDGLDARCTLAPGQTQTLHLIVPYLPLRRDELAKLGELDHGQARSLVAEEWERILSEGSQLELPSRPLTHLLKAQLAHTFMLVDRMDKTTLAANGVPEASHRWQFRRAGMEPPAIPLRDYRVPSGTHSYVHLSATDYEYIWGAESIGVVVPSLCRMGFLKQAREYLDTMFALQGASTVLFQDPDLRADRADAQGLYGTLPSYHNWVNEVGGILWGMAQYYHYGGDVVWLREHAGQLASACQWIQQRRATTRHSAYRPARGLLPRGRATDSPLMGHHYYNDVHSYLGLKGIGRALCDAGLADGEWIVREAEEYRQAIRRSLDGAILPAEDFSDTEDGYDLSSYTYLRPDGTLAPLAPEGSLPERWRGLVFTRQKADELGLRAYVPSAADHRIPLKHPVNGMEFAVMPFIACTDILDPESDLPLVPGSRYTDRQVWDCIVEYFTLSGALGRDGFMFDSDGTPGYGYNIAQFFFWRDRVEDFLNAAFGTIAFTSPTADYAAVESVDNLVPHAFWNVVPMGLTMARCRDFVRQMLIVEDSRHDTLLIAPALPRAWLEDGQAVAFDRAPTTYGVVSFRLASSLESQRRIICHIDLALRRMPKEIRLRLRAPRGEIPRRVQVDGKDSDGQTGEWVVIQGETLRQDHIRVLAYY